MCNLKCRVLLGPKGPGLQPQLLGRLNQEDHKFKTYFDYREMQSPAYNLATLSASCKKKKKMLL